MITITIPYLHGFNKTHFVTVSWIKIDSNRKLFTWYDALFTVQIVKNNNKVGVSIHDNYLHMITNNTFPTIKGAVSYIEEELSHTFNEIILKNCSVGDLHEFTLFELLKNNGNLSQFDSLCF